MVRSVSCRIADRPDSLSDAVATLAPDRTYRCKGFASLAAAEWGLLMAAVGALLVRDDTGPARGCPTPRRGVGCAFRG